MSRAGRAGPPDALVAAWALGARADGATAAAIRRVVALVVLAELLAAGRSVAPGAPSVGAERPGASARRARSVRLARGSQSGRRPRG